MTDESESESDEPAVDAAPLGRRAIALRLAAIGATLALVALAFAATAGWLTPARLTPARIVDTFEHNNGVHAGFRRNHAKGLCLAGHFDSNGAGVHLSAANVFKAGRTPVEGRFALAGGQPYAGDGARTVRSIALRFLPADGGEWRTGMNDIPVFPVRTPDAFEAQLIASRPDPATGKPDPGAMRMFLDAHPESRTAIAAIKAYPMSSGFDDAEYFGLDAFRFIDAAGRSRAVRWMLEPLTPPAPPRADVAGNALFDALIADVAAKPRAWRLVIVLAGPGDATDDATRAWPADRERVDVGTLTVDRVIGEDAGGCRDIVFDPLVLPRGIEPSDDPLLSARSAAYARSFTRRAGETKSPSAVATGTELRR